MQSKFTITSLLFIFLISNVLNAQDCPPASAESITELNGNNVSAIISSAGSMFIDFEEFTTKYEVPVGLGINAVFAASPWMGGLDADGQLKLAANTYRLDGVDYFPGVISENGDAVCGFDMVYTMSKAEVAAFVNSGFETITENITNWPARNNQVLIDQGMDMNHDLAPFFDADNDGNYNPTNGDYPLVKGDNNIWRIFNDAGNVHIESGGEIIGMEIQSMGYSFNTDDYLNDATFWDFDLTYKGDIPLSDFYFGFWIDPDLGEYEDDYVGCYPESNTGFVYNADDLDEAPDGYGTKIPGLAVTYINGLEDNDGNDLGMSSFMFYNNDFQETGNPLVAEDYYNYLKNSWIDGTPITEGGNGYGGTVPTQFMYPATPSNGNGWSECSEETEASDRRFLMVTGPIDLTPGEKQSITVSINFGDSQNFEYPCPDMHTWIDTYKDDMVDFINNIETEVVTSSTANPSLMNKLNISPNPTSGLLNIELNELANLNKAVVFGVDGKQLTEFDLDNKQYQNINLSELNNGIYFVKIYNNYNKIVATKKVIVAK